MLASTGALATMNGAPARRTSAAAKHTGTNRSAVDTGTELTGPHSLMTAPNVQSASVTNTASKNISMASHIRATARLGSAAKMAAVPRTPAMTTGTVMG